jgi:hypothetical protein
VFPNQASNVDGKRECVQNVFPHGSEETIKRACVSLKSRERDCVFRPKSMKGQETQLRFQLKTQIGRKRVCVINEFLCVSLPPRFL